MRIEERNKGGNVKTLGFGRQKDILESFKEREKGGDQEKLKRSLDTFLDSLKVGWPK